MSTHVRSSIYPCMCIVSLFNEFDSLFNLTDQSKTPLNQFLRSTSNIENNDLDILNEDLKLSDVKELLQRYEDASDLMNMDESERRRLGIHHNTYCHCHDNTCHCCRVIYIFWKIPIFKGKIFTTNTT